MQAQGLFKLHFYSRSYFCSDLLLQKSPQMLALWGRVLRRAPACCRTCCAPRGALSSRQVAECCVQGGGEEGQSPGPARPPASALPSLFVTWVCPSPTASVRLPPDGWLRTAQIYDVTAPEVRSLESRCQQAARLLQALREKLFPSPSQLLGPPLPRLGIPFLPPGSWQHSGSRPLSVPLLCRHARCLTPTLLPLSLDFPDFTGSVGMVRGISHPRILNLVTSAKSLLP